MSVEPQRKRWVWVGALAVAAGVLVIGLAVLIFPPFPPVRCDEKVIREFPSPNGWQKAVVMRINCHATTPFVTVVVLVRADREVDLDTQTIFSVKGTDDMGVLWKDDELVIKYRKPDQVYRKAVIWDGQPITYIEREP